MTLPIDRPREVPWSSVPAAVRAAAARAPDQEAAVDAHERLTYAELELGMDRVGRAAMHFGVKPGQSVAVWAPNSVRWLVTVLGLLSAGARVVAVSTRFKGNEAAHSLRTSEAVALFTVDGYMGLDFAGMLDGLIDIPTVRLDDPAFLAGADEVGADTHRARCDAIADDDIAFMLFTSGTTGRPKGAMQRHRGMLWTGAQLRDGFGLVEGDRQFVVLPFFHVFGLAMIISSIVSRGALITTDAAFDPAAAVELIQRERITFVPGPPPVFTALLAARGDADLATLRTCFVASTTIPGPLVRRIKTDGLFEFVTTGYGLTEGLIVSLSRLDEDTETTAEWSGQILPEAEVRVLDDGEFVVRTPSTMAGYYNDPEATAAALDDDGWLRTGDVGTVDDRGYVRVTDRKKDMFIVGGFNAYPAEIEAMLAEHPDVGEVAVVGMPDERMGEVGVAFVVPAGAGADPDQIIDWARGQMANYKVPRRVILRDALPMTASMKVAKFELRKEL